MRSLILVTLLVIACLPGVDMENVKEVKRGFTMYLCGENFIKAWKTVCALKAKRLTLKAGRPKRSISEMIKPRSINLMKQKNALQFLHSSRVRRQVLQGGTDDANEECCMESCSVAEIAEYKC